MKKIVALVLAMVMVLGLATTAFAAIPLWTVNNSTQNVDVFDGEYNTKTATGVMKYTAAKAPVVDAAGNVTAPGNIAYYTFTATGATATDLYVKVDSIPATADASDYILVKVADATVAVGDTMLNQSAADQVIIMKSVVAIHYVATGSLYTAWGNLCGQYKQPADVAAPVEQEYVNFTMKGLSYVVAADADVADTPAYNILVGDEVYTYKGAALTKTPHTWVASKWNAKSIATEYTCTTCKTVATVINASVNAPAGATVEKLADGTLIAFFYTPGVEAGAGAGQNVESAKTFDAGIAMYVGMSVMAAAGSAVVLKKKD